MCTSFPSPVEAMIRRNHYDCLVDYHQTHSSWEPYHAELAALHGRLDILEFLYDTGCTFTMLVPCKAVGHLACLRFLHNKAPFNITTAEYAIRTHSLQSLEFLYECIPFEFDRLTAVAADFGAYDCLEYLHHIYMNIDYNDALWTSEATEAATRNGHLMCLQYLVENGCPFTDRVSTLAVKYNQSECLRYLIENECPLDRTRAMYYAIIYSVSCLEYLLNLGCTMTPEILLLVLQSNNIEGVHYMLESGCVVTEEIMLWATRHETTAARYIRQYVASNIDNSNHVT